MWYERFFFSCKKSEASFTRNCWIYQKTMATRHSDENLPGILKGLFMNDVT